MPALLSSSASFSAMIMRRARVTLGLPVDTATVASPWVITEGNLTRGSGVSTLLTRGRVLSRSSLSRGSSVAAM